MIRETRIRLDASGHGEIVVDGTPIQHGVKALRLESDAGGKQPTRLTLELTLHQVEYFGEAQLLITDGARDALIALGWTPPSDLAPERESLEQPDAEPAA